MKVIPIKAHALLDYFTVLAFASIPDVFGLTETPAYLSYLLAAVHLLMTVLTDFPGGVIKVVPLKLHKLVETVVGPALLVIPWLLGFSQSLTARYVFVAAGVVIIAVGFLTDYFGENHHGLSS